MLGTVEVRGVRFEGFLVEVDVEVDELGGGVWIPVGGRGILGDVG